MQMRTRVIDADGDQFVLEPSSLRASCEGRFIVRRLNPDGTVGAPTNLPDSDLHLAGTVFMSCGLREWLATDRRLDR